MSSTAAHHAVDIIGGRINLHVSTGNVSMDIVANTHLEPIPTMLTPFITPQDDFNHNFPIDERNISSSNKALATQVPLTSTSVLDESNGFQDRVVSTEGHIDENIPPFTLSTVKPAGTIGQSSTTALTSKPLSSAENTPSHSDTTSQTSSITEATKTKRIDISIDTFSSSKIERTTVASIFLTKYVNDDFFRRIINVKDDIFQPFIFANNCIFQFTSDHTYSNSTYSG